VSQLEFSGLDGADPLGFLAALGALRVLDEHFHGSDFERPRLAWTDRGYWRPTAFGVESIAHVVDIVMADLQVCERDPVFRFAYSKDPPRRVEPNHEKSIADLKAPPNVQRELYREIATSSSPEGTRSSRMLSAFGTEIATDNGGFAKPTALHFTAGQQQFLDMATKLRAGVGAEDFERALCEPMDPDSDLPSFSWSATGQRLYAYRAGDPSGDQRKSCAGTEWLALRGLSFMKCFPELSGQLSGRHPATRTTGVRGGWKDAAFTWPLWTPPATVRSIESLLRTPDLENAPERARLARGVMSVFQAEILRTDQGGYGSFKPPRAV